MHEVYHAGGPVFRLDFTSPPRRSAMTGVGPWKAPDGLAGYHWRAERARANLLLQHGFAEHSGRYVSHANRLVPQLNALGIDVYAFDFSGHGRSPGRRGDADVRRMVAAHKAARRELAGMGLPLFLFGHSLGGLVTAASVAASPGQVDGVILSAPSLPEQLRPIDRLRLGLTALVAPMKQVVPPGDPAGLTRIDDELRALGDDPLVSRLPLPARVAATALATARNMEEGLAAWTAPTFVVHGTADNYTDPQGSARLIAAIASRDKALHMIEGGRHELLNDLPRDEVLALIVNWIDLRFITIDPV